jgi:hypothetical protein
MLQKMDPAVIVSRLVLAREAKSAQVRKKIRCHFVYSCDTAFSPVYSFVLPFKF